MYKTQENQERLFQKLMLREDLLSTEQIRMIRTNLNLIEANHPLSFLVTSPVFQEQKPYISTKLAISIAEQGKRVLLVDANMRQPSLHKLFYLDNSVGLTNILSKDVDRKGLAQETFVTGLSVLTTGPISIDHTPIWISSEIKDTVNYLKNLYEVVIFEGPDFLSISDSQILANFCDGIVLVVQANKTKKADILHTKYTLERANKKILGVIYQTG